MVVVSNSLEGKLLCREEGTHRLRRKPLPRATYLPLTHTRPESYYRGSPRQRNNKHQLVGRGQVGCRGHLLCRGHWGQALWLLWCHMRHLVHLGTNLLGKYSWESFFHIYLPICLFEWLLQYYYSLKVGQEELVCNYQNPDTQLFHRYHHLLCLENRYQNIHH